MARWTLAVVDLDGLDAAGRAALDAALVCKRDVHPDMQLVVTAEERARANGLTAEQKRVQAAKRFIDNGSLARLNTDINGTVWNYHLERTGIPQATAIAKGFDWLKVQPDADAATVAPAPGVPGLGGDV